jgi:hypothetical protein
VTQPLPAGTLPALPTTIPTLPGLPPITAPAVPTIPDPTTLIPAPLATAIRSLFLPAAGTSASAAAVPCRRQAPFTVQGERTQYPRVKPSANGTGPVGP